MDKLEIVDQWSTRIPPPLPPPPPPPPPHTHTHIGEGGIVKNHKAAILKAT